MRYYIFLFFLFATLASKAQPGHNFTKGLVLSDCHRYGREALVTDKVAYQLYKSQFQPPRENAYVFTNDKGVDVAWQKIDADSTGKFIGDVVNNAYLYLTYESDHPGNALLNISGNSMVYFNGEPHTGDIYGDGWMNIPVKLKAGTNHILIRCGGFARWQGVSAKLTFPDKPVLLNVDDATLPHIVIGNSVKDLLGAVVIINNSEKVLKGLTITARLNGKETTTPVSEVEKGTMRKVGFALSPAGIAGKGDYSCAILLKQSGKVLDEKQVTINAVNSSEHQTYTFVSNIDGSVQYYSVAPPLKDLTRPALFLSVHGAGVQAIGQARAYSPKDWGVLVAPTNRRPRGFNWEDWGRIDALEVLELARKQYNPDPERIYLTGHSMGGHGTWYLGATYPEKWAAIAPCAAYPTLTAYGSADGKIPNQSRSTEEELLLRASNASDVIVLASNYKDLGVYIHHGDSDKVVSVDYARQMRKVLGEFHSDFSYYEYPGGSHWFGNESVDWPPIFDFFKWHKIAPDTSFDKIDFITANPGISSQYRWASVIQQAVPLAFSKFHLERNRKAATISGTTTNVSMLKLRTDFVRVGDSLVISLDSVTIRTVANEQHEIWLAGFPEWKIAPAVSARHKNPVRAGAFKEAFNHRMVYVYGTRGTKEENNWAYNKARYDAEVWYYRGNGSVDIIPDEQFESAKYKDRGVILYGNNKTNTAWNKLLKNCPIKVMSDKIALGAQIFSGRDLGVYFTWPREDSDVAMIAAVGGTGLEGMRATDPNQYFAAASGFPDYLIFSTEMLNKGPVGIKAAGFFDNEWRLQQTADRPRK